MTRWISEHLFFSLCLLAVTFAVWCVIQWIRRALSPPFRDLEWAVDEIQAKRVLAQWPKAGRWRAGVTVVLDMVLFVPLYLLTAVVLAAGFDTPFPSLETVTVLFGWLVAAAALVNIAEDGLLLVTLVTRANPMVVWFTRRMAGFKYAVLALTIIFALLRYELYLHVKLRDANFDNVLPALIAATLLVWFFVARTMTSIAQQHPPVLSLQLAPSWLAAKDVLEKWGVKGRRTAQVALAMDSLLAVLYGLTLATIFYRLHLATGDEWSVPGAVAWLALIAAACQLAQNLGASIAVRRREIGWWVHPMRKAGKTRLYLLGVMAGYVVWLLLAFEGRLLLRAGEKIAAWATETWS